MRDDSKDLPSFDTRDLGHLCTGKKSSHHLSRETQLKRKGSGLGGRFERLLDSKLVDTIGNKPQDSGPFCCTRLVLVVFGQDFNEVGAANTLFSITAATAQESLRCIVFETWKETVDLEPEAVEKMYLNVFIL